MDKYSQQRRGSLALAGALALWATGCQHTLDELPARELSLSKPERLLPPPPPYSIEVPENLRFPALKATSYEIRALVPSPGVPTMEIEGLPAGAAFDAGVLSWAPTVEDSRSEEAPGQYFRFHPITIRLTSSLDPEAVLVKTIYLIAQLGSAEVSIEVGPMELLEGSEGSQEITVTSPEFPQGPFEVYSSDLPSGAVLEEVRGRFRVSYTPGFHEVTTQDQLESSHGTHYRQREVSFVAVLPNGKKAVARTSWTIHDRRLPPLISAPRRVEGDRGGVQFLMRVDDRNGETIPSVAFDMLPGGRVVIDRLQSSESDGFGLNPYQTVRISWLDIPAELAGKTVQLESLVCVFRESTVRELCDDLPIEVMLRADPVVEPSPVPAPPPGGRAMSDVSRARAFPGTLFFQLLAWNAPALASAPEGELPLEEQLQQLSLPDNQAPVSVASERLYSIQSRYAPLKLRSELSLGALMALNGNSFINSQSLSASYRLHLSDRWSIGLTGNYAFSSWTDSARELLEQDKRYPDVAYAKDRVDLQLGYNVFYGKFRLSMDQVFYFDQYVSAGVGTVGLNTGRQTAGVADIGFVLWLGRKGSFRLGVKDYFYDHRRRLSGGMAHELVGHVDAGFMFGGAGT